MEILEYKNWRRPVLDETGEVKQRVRAMLEKIETEGDAAIRAFSQELDGFAPQSIQLEPWESYPLRDELRRSLQNAAERIEAFAETQRFMYRDVLHQDDYGRYGHRVVPLERAVAYIPGGRFPLVSTALMTLIPANVAGVPHRVAFSPSDHPALLAAASLAGATEFLRIGGAQAVAAAAFGYDGLPKADMIAGPGNAYVNAAKALLQERLKIDSLAGPSELLTLCDNSLDPRWLALDVLAQAEHDPMALSVVASVDRKLLETAAEAIESESAAHPDKDTGLINLVHCADVEDMVALANSMAPEHLHVSLTPGALDTQRLVNYGSLFIGPYSAVALGDYCSGPNHTLPTMGMARCKGGLQVGDFLKVLTFQEIEPYAYAELAATAIELAKAEELLFHQKSLEART